MAIGRAQSGHCTLPLLPTEVVVVSEHEEEAQDGRKDDRVSRQDERACAPRNQVRSGEDDRQPKRGHHDASGEEDGQLLAGITRSVRVLYYASCYAVWNRRQHVEKQYKQRPILTILRQRTTQHEKHQADRSPEGQADQSFNSSHCR